MSEEEKNEQVEAVNETATPESNTKGGENSMKRNVVSIVVAAIVILGALELSGTVNLFGGLKTVATVNGEKISQAEFDTRLEQILNSPQAQALSLDNPLIREQVRQQVLTEIINTKLLLQAASKAGFSASDEEVQTEYDLILERFGSQELLNQELANGGIDMKQFRENIHDQIVIQRYLDANTDLSTITVTDEEIADFYEQVTAGQEDVPSLEEIRPQIEQQLLIQKEQVEVGNIILELRDTAEIDILVEEVAEETPPAEIEVEEPVSE